MPEFLKNKGEKSKEFFKVCNGSKRSGPKNTGVSVISSSNKTINPRNFNVPILAMVKL